MESKFTRILVQSLAAIGLLAVLGFIFMSIMMFWMMSS
ncbi:hypothetical protein BOMU111920_16655 [Bordetella muralis]